MAKYLKDLMHKYKLEEKFKDNKINLIVSPVGSGKTTYIMDFIKRKGYQTFNQKDGNIIYVVDTSNLKQCISMLYGNQLIESLNLTYDEVFHTLENGNVLVKNGMSILTYSALNTRLELGQINIGDIFIFDEPTRGIDIGAKSEIYDLIEELAANGKSIIMISSELSEIQRLSDRVVVMCEGRITNEIDIKDATQEEIMKYATMREESYETA